MPQLRERVSLSAGFLAPRRAQPVEGGRPLLRRWIETPSVAGFVFLCGLAAAVYAPHIEGGGFWFDDWRVGLAVRHSSGIFGSRGALTADGVQPRPLQGIVETATHKLFGLHTKEHLLFAVVVSLVASALLYVLLRKLLLSRAVATGAAALFLVFPWGDGSQLWPQASQNQIAVVLVLLGACLSLHASGRRWTWAVAAAAAYLAAVLQYEEIVGLIPVLALIAAARIRTRSGVFQALGYVVAAGVGVAVVLGVHQGTGQTGTSGSLHHAGVIVQESWQLLGLAVTPATPLWHIGAIAAAVLVTLALGAWHRLPSSHPASPGIRLGLVVVVVGVVLVGAGYLAIVPASDWYVPLQPGQGTRTNTAAAVGWTVLVTGLAILLTVLALQVVMQRRRRDVEIGLLVLLGLACLSWSVRTTSDARDWTEAAQIQQNVLSLIGSVAPNAPAGSTFVVFGAPRATSPEVPVFLEPSDMTDALQLTFNRSLVGWPILGATQVTCGSVGPQTSGGWIPPQSGAVYGKTFFVDYPDTRVVAVPSRAICNQLLPGLHAGPLAEYQ